MAGLVSYESRDGVACVRIQREDKRNAFNRELSLAVIEAVDAAEADDGVRVLVITGTGEAFCAGADMSEAMAALDAGVRGDAMAQAVVRIAAFSKPVIAAVNGYAFGSGAMLAIVCDLRVASERATFRFPGASYGLVVGGSQLPRIVGAPKAKELIFTARVVEAAEAARIGLVNEVVPHEALEDAVWQVAGQIAAQSPDAVRWSKRVIDAATTVEKGTDAELEANRALRGSADHVSRFREATDRVAGRQ